MRGAVRGSADRKVIRLTRPVVNFNPAFGSRRFESSHRRCGSENFDSKDRSSSSKFVECVVVSTSCVGVFRFASSPPDSKNLGNFEPRYAVQNFESTPFVSITQNTSRPLCDIYKSAPRWRESANDASKASCALPHRPRGQVSVGFH